MANFSRALKHTFVGQTMEWKEMSNPHTAAAHAAVDKGEQSTRNERAYVYALVSVCVCGCMALFFVAYAQETTTAAAAAA